MLRNVSVGIGLFGISCYGIHHCRAKPQLCYQHDACTGEIQFTLKNTGIFPTRISNIGMGYAANTKENEKIRSIMIMMYKTINHYGIPIV